MKPEYKQKLLQALQSKQYKFGKERLYDPEKECFCVLGVLADQIAKDFPDKYKWEDGGLHVFGSKTVWYHSLPKEIFSIAGLEDGLGTFGNNENDLAHINDKSEGFDDLIPIIQEHF